MAKNVQDKIEDVLAQIAKKQEELQKLQQQQKEEEKRKQIRDTEKLGKTLYRYVTSELNREVSPNEGETMIDFLRQHGYQ